MKKFSALLLSALLCLCMFGCSNTNDAAASSGKTQIASSLQAEESDSRSLESTSSSDHLTKNSQKSEIQKNSTAQKEKTTQKSQAQSKTQEKTTAKATEKSTKKQSPTKSTTTTTTTSAYVTCTVTIECKKVLNNMNKLKAGHEAYIPSDGYMINSQSVTVKNGASAYDAVKTACSQNGVTINSSGSSYGIYIAGFNNIDEKDCGQTSGWLYYVNAKQPQQSCGRYTVKNGDSIVFSYTC